MHFASITLGFVLNPATVATTAYPTPAPNPLKEAEVYPQGKQQTPEQSNTTAEGYTRTHPQRPRTYGSYQ